MLQDRSNLNLSHCVRKSLVLREARSACAEFHQVMEALIAEPVLLDQRSPFVGALHNPEFVREHPINRCECTREVCHDTDASQVSDLFQRIRILRLRGIKLRRLGAFFPKLVGSFARAWTE